MCLMILLPLFHAHHVAIIVICHLNFDDPDVDR